MSRVAERSCASDFAGKVVLITGAASGIGRATASLFAQHGASVAVADIDQNSAMSAVDEIVAAGGEADVVSLDVARAEAWDAALETVHTKWGGLHVLINCAGITDDAPLAELSLEQWRHVMSVNLDGVFLGTAAAIREMRERGSGAIVNVASLSGIKAFAGTAAYAASKAAVIHLTKVAAVECGEAGLAIRVNCVAPGGVKTPMWEHTPVWPAISESAEWQAPATAPPLKRFATAREVAEAIVFLASDAASYISGAVLTVDGAAAAM